MKLKLSCKAEKQRQKLLLYLLWHGNFFANKNKSTDK